MRIRQITVSLVATLIGLAHASSVHGQVLPLAGPVPSVVFVCNGSGGDTELTRGLFQARARSGDCFALETFPWSRFDNSCLDYQDAKGQCAAAKELSCRILAFRQLHPDTRVFVVSFSAGTGVALEATRSLPPGSIDRIIVLGSSLSNCYNLAPALLASNEGIDNFYNHKDCVLQLAEDSVGSSDGKFVPIAGRVGFWPPMNSPDCHLYAQNLRQYAYNPAVAWTGHSGHHSGWTEPGFLAAYVLPLLR